MSKLLKGFLLGLVMTFIASGSAMALSLDYFTGNVDDSIYKDTGASYVLLTDETAPESAPMIELSSTILAEYGQDYIVGIFEFGSTLDNMTDLNVLDTYLGTTSSNVIFDLSLGTVSSAIDTETMGTTFGFFLQFYTDDSSGILSNEIYYSDSDLGEDVFSIFYDIDGISSTGFSELALGIGGPESAGHALVSVYDVAPVPEPATMLLFGMGLLGLAGVSRKKMNV